MGSPSELESLRQSLRQFVDERDWSKFHTPRNLASALAVEAAELLEIFQWDGEPPTSDDPGDRERRTNEEVADVFIYLVRLADTLDIDLISVANDKIEMNRRKYPVEKVYGTMKKLSSSK